MVATSHRAALLIAKNNITRGVLSAAACASWRALHIIMYRGSRHGGKRDNMYQRAKASAAAATRSASGKRSMKRKENEIKRTRSGM